MDDATFILLGKCFMYASFMLAFGVVGTLVVYAFNQLFLAILNVKENMELLWKFRKWQKKQEATK